jgi:hypothetical protein
MGFRLLNEDQIYEKSTSWIPAKTLLDKGNYLLVSARKPAVNQLKIHSEG